MSKKGSLNGTLAKVIKVRRLHKGWSQAQLAETSKIDKGHMSQIEKGLVNPSYETLYKIATALGTTASSISTEVEEEYGDYILIEKEE